MQRVEKETVISCTRYGNVMASRGSVIPLFIKQIREGKDPNMTRFMMFAFKNGDTFVQKAPACTVELLANMLGKSEHKINIIGTRHGEKLFLQEKRWFMQLIWEYTIEYLQITET